MKTTAGSAFAHKSAPNAINGLQGRGNAAPFTSQGLAPAVHILDHITGEHRPQVPGLFAAAVAREMGAIAEPLDCGCVPCTGQCRSNYALEIEVEARQDIARAALKDAPNVG